MTGLVDRLVCTSPVSPLKFESIRTPSPSSESTGGAQAASCSPHTRRSAHLLPVRRRPSAAHQECAHLELQLLGALDVAGLKAFIPSP